MLETIHRSFAIALKFSIRCTLVFTFALLPGVAFVKAQAAAITFVQASAGPSTIQSSNTTVAVAYTAAEGAGHLNVVAVGWGDTTSTITSVTDTQGNLYTAAVGPTSTTGLRQMIYYAKNIAGGSNTVTVRFNQAAAYPDVRILEYAGADPSSPLDQAGAATGSGTTANSGSVTTTSANELIFSSGTTGTVFSAAGSGYTNRKIDAYGNIAEDKTVTSTGSYNATATTSSSSWVMQILTFRTSSGQMASPPTLTSITPTSGTTAGATSVTITGTGFASGASVMFGTTAATNVVVVSSTSITATTPAHAAGAVNVVVTNADSQSGTLPSGYTYNSSNPAPTVTSITPPSGTTTGGTSATIAGTGFASGASVMFGTTAATNVVVVSSTSITATTPAHAAGAVNVVVTNIDSQSGTLTNGYTYSPANPAPTIVSIAPNSGTTAGGTSTTITGTGFLPGATVSLGGTAATNVVVVNSTSITATTPAHAAGAVNVVVTNTDGQSGTLTSGYTYTGISGGSISFVQASAGPSSIQSSNTTVAVAYTAAEGAGHLNVVAVGWGDTTSTITSVTDTLGNLYTLAIGPTSNTGLRQEIYYAKNIAGGSNTVTVRFNQAPAYPDVRILEYAGADPSNPLDQAGAGTGSGTTANSGSVTTTSASELIFASGTTGTAFSAAGSGYTSRKIDAYGNIAEDKTVTSTGSYNATATTSSSAWVMQVVAFRAVVNGGVPSPTIASLNPTSGLVGTSVMIAGSNFESTGTVTFNGVTATPTSWSAASIVVPVPTGATTGNVVVTAGGVASNGVKFTVTSAVATPTFGPGTGTYSSAQTVTISSTTSGATLCYTTNGSAPAANTPGTCSSGTPLANGGTVVVSTSETLKVIGTESGFANSGVASASYTISSCIQGLAIGSFTLCGEIYNVVSAGTNVKVNYSPSPNNGIIAWATWCFTSACNSSISGVTATIGDNINATESCFVASPHSPFVTDANGGGQGSGDFQQHYVWYCPNIPPGVTSFTVTPNNPNLSYLQVNITEWKAGSLAPSCSPISACFENVDNLEEAGNATGGTTATITTSGPTVNPNDLVFAGTQVPCCTFTSSAGPGYTGISVAPSLNPGMVSEAKAATAGIQTATTTWIGGSTYWFGVIVPIIGAGAPPVATMPTFNPGAGTYNSPQTVTISSPTSGATVCYTTDGSTPAANSPGTCSSGTPLANGGTVVVSTSETLNAIGTESGFTNSGVGSASYTIQPIIDSLTPDSGPAGTMVTIAGANFGTIQGTVNFNGAAVPVTSWTGSSIVVMVPAGAMSGDVTVTAGGTSSIGVNFTVPLLTMPAQSQVLAAIKTVNDYWIANNAPGNSDWTQATYFTGDLAAYDATGQSNYLSFAQTWASNNSYSLTGGNTTTYPNYQAAGQVYIRLYQLNPVASDIAGITQSVDGMVNSSVDNEWTWIDAINMSMPDFVELGSMNNDTNYYTKMYALYSYAKYSLGLYDSNTGLWWENSTFTNTSTYWSRGDGWVFAAHAKVLSVLPKSDPHYAEYLSTFITMAQALAARQQPGGYWNSDLGGTDYAGPESSGTSFFLYGFAWGLNNGILDSNTYLPVVENAWSFLANTAIQPSGLLGYVQPSGSGPGATTATTTEDFGVGAFLLAARQMALLTQ